MVQAGVIDEQVNGLPRQGRDGCLNLRAVGDVQRKQLQCIAVRRFERLQGIRLGTSCSGENFAAGFQKLAHQFQSDTSSSAGDKNGVAHSK